LLFVFDDVLLQHFKEKYVFDLANQPFAPTNICNEIMENTGVFNSKKATVTSIMIIDKESTSMMFQKDELTLIQHLESIADQVLDFGCESNSRTKGHLP
jgi:hypothetical protein